MLFFANPKRGRKSRRKVRRSRVRVRRAARRSSPTKGASMARRKRSRRAGATVRRRRRRSTGRTRRFAAVRAYLPNPRRRRRRYRRNPFGGGGGGVVNTLKNGVKDGLVVLASQAVTRRGLTFVTNLNPIKGIAGTAISGLGTAVIVSMIGKKALPTWSRLISAAAFAEGIRGIIALTPAAPLFADYNISGGGVDVEDGYGAWPQIPATVQAQGMGAWPQFGNAEEDAMYQ